jgi:hypothetical protein
MHRLGFSIFRSAIFMGMVFVGGGKLSAANQTPTVSEIQSDESLPFRVRIKKANFDLPHGVQSYIHAVHHDKWLLITGRVGGLHGFVSDSQHNFPVNEQNTTLFVIDPIRKKTYTRSLLDPESGLTQEQIDLLSVTAAQGYQSGKTLYITGGYGFDSSTGRPNTKNALTAINVPGLIHWVVKANPGETAAEHIRQIFDDTFKVTGGYMNQSGSHPTLLIMGQEFNGFYSDPVQIPPVFQKYSEQVRRFRIIDDGKSLSVVPESSLPLTPDPNYRRRDLNVVPVIKKEKRKLKSGFVALSGVFTPTDGVWTVPVEITTDGELSMADPNLASTFKQGMNNYDTASFGLFSKKTGEMYTVLLGGMSFGFFNSSGMFTTDDLIPFINQTTTIRIDRDGNFSQHFMTNGAFPTILSQDVNPGNPLLFGAESEVILLKHTPKYSNDVIRLDSIKRPTVIGYVVGGIKSTLPNTNTQADSSPSSYIFKVIVEPVCPHSSM